MATVEVIPMLIEASSVGQLTAATLGCRRVLMIPCVVSCLLYKDNVAILYSLVKLLIYNHL